MQPLIGWLNHIIMKCFSILLAACMIINANEAFGQGRLKSNKFDSYIPPNYRIMDLSSADLNNDHYIDYVLVLQSIGEAWDGNEARPLLIILGSAKERFSLLARNDNIVLPKNGGGVFGDPYKGLSLKNGYIAVEHSVGVNWKWDRIISLSLIHI